VMITGMKPTPRPGQGDDRGEGLSGSRWAQASGRVQRPAASTGGHRPSGTLAATSRRKPAPGRPTASRRRWWHGTRGTLESRVDYRGNSAEITAGEFRRRTRDRAKSRYSRSSLSAVSVFFVMRLEATISRLPVYVRNFPTDAAVARGVSFFSHRVFGRLSEPRVTSR